MDGSEVVTEPPCTKRRRGFAPILLIAFIAGLCATFATARHQRDPYRGVYRQAAIGVVVEESGTLISLAKSHGEPVRPGQTLATMTTFPSAESLAGLSRKIDEATGALAAARDDAAMELALQNERVEDDRLETRLRYADLLRARLSVQTRKQALREKDRDRTSIVKTSADTTTASPDADRVSLRLQVADAINHEEVLQTQIQLCEDRLAKLDLLQASLPTRIEDSYDISRLETELADLRTKYEAAKAAESERDIVSPAYGRVGVWRQDVGEFASAGQTVVEIFDAERPFVLLRVPVSELLELTVGREVRVEFQGISTKKALEGVVHEIRSDAERDADSAIAPGATEALVRIIPTGRLWPAAPPGTTARVYLE